MQQPVLNFMPQSHILHIVIIWWYYCFGIIFLKWQYNVEYPKCLYSVKYKAVDCNDTIYNECQHTQNNGVLQQNKNVTTTAFRNNKQTQ